MPDLRGLQESFLAHLLSGDQGVADRVRDTGGIGVDQRLGIYANAYHRRLLEALADTYPAVHTLLGDERFEGLAMAYLACHPSRHYSIRWAGHGLPGFLGQEPAYREVPVLTEMAAFEWALRDAFDERDAVPVGMPELRAVPERCMAGLRFELHPSLRRLDLTWNVPALWKTIDQGQAPVPPQAQGYPVGWLVWRRDLRILFRSLAVDEAFALDGVRDGLTFADLCEGLCEWVDEPQVPTRAVSLVGNWLGEGLITGLA